jgi:hypothetical protein
MAGDFTDPKNERLVLLAAGGLAVVGLLLLSATVVWWRNSRVEHPALAPLEVMSARRFGKAADGEQRRLLDSARPEGSKPLAVAEPERVDLRTSAAVDENFDDLRDAQAAAVAALVEVTKGLNRPAEPRQPDLDALLEAHAISLTEPASTIGAAPAAEPGDGPIDPLLQRFESSER